MRGISTRTDEAPDERQAVAPVGNQLGIFRDPVVVRMAYLAIGLVILFLATVAGALVSGVTAQSGPRTLAEKEAAVSGETIRQGSTDAAVWGQHIASLIASGQNLRAKDLIGQAKKSIDDSATAELTLAEARLYTAEKQWEKVIETADLGMQQIQDALAAAISSGGQTAATAKRLGLHENYYILVLLKAEAYRETGEWGKAIEQYDIYIESNPGAADILVDRGNAKVEIKDTKGAEADFRKALTFIPDSAEALAGLKKIGAAN